MIPLEHSPLGKSAVYPQHCDPTLLFAIARAPKRAEIGLASGDTLPFFGADVWTAFELSWLNPRGKPQLAIAHITIPCETPHIIESKSLKLYLGSLQQTHFANAEEVGACIRQDLSQVAWQGSGNMGSIGLTLVPSECFAQEQIHTWDGLLLDRLEVECRHYTPTPELLHANHAEAPVCETLVSHLLKSNCPVTGQPDWGSVQISYSGAPIDQAGLLQYIVSFRQHNDFHEHCAERIFTDIWTRCRPTQLTVYARYTRRGGLDINPFRTSSPQALPRNMRLARQ